MTDVIDASAGIGVVWTFYIGSTLIRGLLAVELANLGGYIDRSASVDLSQTAELLGIASELHEVVDGVVDGFDAIRIVNREFWIVGCLNVFINNAVTDSQCIEIKIGSIYRTV